MFAYNVGESAIDSYQKWFKTGLRDLQSYIEILSQQLRKHLVEAEWKGEEIEQSINNNCK